MWAKLKFIFLLQQDVVDVVLAAVLGVPRVDPVVFGLPSQSLCPRRAGEKIVHILDNILITFSFQVDCRWWRRWRRKRSLAEENWNFSFDWHDSVCPRIYIQSSFCLKLFLLIKRKGGSRSEYQEFHIGHELSPTGTFVRFLLLD